MVSIPVIHVSTWITTHLLTLDEWKAELAKMACNTIETKDDKMTKVYETSVTSPSTTALKTSQLYVITHIYYSLSLQAVLML